MSLLGAILFAWTSAGHACGVTTPTSVSIGPFSPSAIKAGVVPLTPTLGGFSCTNSQVLGLLSGNYLKATVTAASTLTLTSGGNSVPYKLYADSAGTAELKPGVMTYYINGALLSLLSTNTTNVPVHFKLSSAGYPPAGTYTGSFQIKWEWYFCSVNALGICILGPIDSGNVTGTVNVTLTVQANPPTVTIAMGAATWNAVEGTSNPKALPGSKRRMTVTVNNPDIVAVDANVLQITVPTPPKMTIALDGDGTGGNVVRTTDGNPASGLTLSYVASNNGSDNVEFSSDGGTNFTAAPVAGDAVSQAAITHVKFRPQGSMAAGSSYTISIPYSVN
ncbi:spore coat protein U domain-containing protein [Sphingomonas crocodyli]|uniref:Protein CsuE n=1 Tax=Sphingomonas crocodyli TaxID=1979270 RepID=A0A437MB45_9SPHN|nr:spore coat protein U domain-containing protein [Sphingomonas crocodyli]RVT94855.1 protein CsuE [Sphingomonas crocodyli]